MIIQIFKRIFFFLEWTFFLVSCVSQPSQGINTQANSNISNTFAPTISISLPYTNDQTPNTVFYTLTYTGATSISLIPTNVTLKTNGSVNGVISILGTGNVSRIVSVSSLSGVGSLSISIVAGTAVGALNSSALASSPSTVFNVFSSNPTISISAPSLSITNSTDVSYIVSYGSAGSISYNTVSSISLNASNITLIKTGTANATVNISGSGNSSRLVTLSNITGEGTLGISIAANTAIDINGNTVPASSASTPFTIDKTAPTLSISLPSLTNTSITPVYYTVTYSGASSISLLPANIILNQTGTANANIVIRGSGNTTRTISLENITGTGTLGISIAANTATDAASNLALASGASTTFNVNNTSPTVTISNPSKTLANYTSTVIYTLTYTGATSINLTNSQVILNTTNGTNANVMVNGTGSTTRTVTLSNIVGDGTLGITIASNSAVDSFGNSSFASNPSATFTVDNTPPAVSISAPSLASTSNTPVNFTVNYTNASAITLAASNIIINKTGTATAVISSVQVNGLSSATVTMGSIGGSGTIGISVAAGTANDSAGNIATAANNSQTFIVSNATPTVVLSSPSSNLAYSNSSITYTATYSGVANITLTNANITINKTNTANATTVSVSGTGGNSRTITISGFSGFGNIGITLAANTGTDVANVGTNGVSSPTNIVVVTDPLGPYAWHLHNTGQSNFATNPGTSGVDLNLISTWSQGYFGQGINILVSDTGVESAHEDLSLNFLGGASSKDFTNGVAPNYLYATAEPVKSNTDAGSAHGTAVAGLIAAVGGNGVGTIGIAPSAKIAAANWLASDQTLAKELIQVSDSNATIFRIINQSWWISSQCNFYPVDSSYVAKLQSERKIYVKIAGNGFDQNIKDCRGTTDIYRHGNANQEGYNNNPYTIVVGAVNASGQRSSYSSIGANLWIAGLGGEYGDTDPALMTTDLMGCTYGEAPLVNLNNFQTAANALNSNCNYTSIMNGTSAAAPTVSGAIALILSANSSLTTRDVKHILASTATVVDPQFMSAGWHYNNNYAVSPAGHIWEQTWVQNKAGFNFHNFYGFGLVNVDAAVKMATNNFAHLPAEQQSGFLTSGNVNLAIPDNSATGVTSSINVSQNYTVEAVQIIPNISHGNIGQIGFELYSPSGTKSIIMNVNNSMEGLTDYTDPSEIFLSNAFYGENSAGNWTLKVIDGASGTTGTFNNWQINIIGH